ncbi:hypothetical protein Poly41_71200 [Novipirellula artificiosorum]|uniref:Uncharacterized protein n=1 Tax=Novipirellula artificiosorum TaxID=2528016 RepID=A0A5C6CEX0_9BACT|nr:hypothetical protein Poly41_71200 [Novipirellula artificiosorum]
MKSRSLLSVIRGCTGEVMLSRYANRMYDEELLNWNRHDFEIDNKTSVGKTKRIMTESVWCNF